MSTYKTGGNEPEIITDNHPSGRAKGSTFNSVPPNLSDTEKYSDRIGTGDDAKSSVVWFVITFTLVLYACLISVLIIVDIFNNNGTGILNNIKESWGVFTPIITLSLGYMFGKSEMNKKESNNEDKDK